MRSNNGSKIATYLPLGWLLFVCATFLLFMIAGFNSALAENQFLEPEQAFQFSSQQTGPNKIEVTFQIADGYYMYRERFKLSADGAVLGEAIYPPGEIKFDETFQKELETFHNSVTIQIPLQSVDQAKSSFTLHVISQGCSEKGLCYVPMESTETFDTAKFSFTGPGADAGAATVRTDKTNRLSRSLQSGRFVIIIPLFILLGLGLAFTPCVLPMVPILSSMIIGDAVASRRHGLIISITYSLGMAIVYTALGIVAGLMGEGLAATLQNPWTLSVFAGLLVLLSLSMFNVYHFQMPVKWQSKLSHISNNQRAGKLLGVFIMGAISALIVGPCVAAPLASALLYISQTQNVLIGGVALFSMALGMSAPLILVGMSAGTILPRAGRWMELVKHFFGVLMLAMALWLMSPVLPAWIEMLAWAALLIGYGVFLFRDSAIWPKVAALLLCALGVVELVGLATGGRNVFAPLAHLTAHSSTQSAAKPEFKPVKSIAELDAALAQAKMQKKFVMLDFYADWCVACKEMERFTFSDERVRNELTHLVLLQVDVTANNAQDKALLKRFNLFGPPGIIFFGLDSQESGRVIGYESANDFLDSLALAIK